MEKKENNKGCLVSMIIVAIVGLLFMKPDYFETTGTLFMGLIVLAMVCFLIYRMFKSDSIKNLMLELIVIITAIIGIGILMVNYELSYEIGLVLYVVFSVVGIYYAWKSIND